MTAADANDFFVPEGWIVAALGDGLVENVQPGFACGAHNRGGEGVAHLRPMNVNASGKIELSDVKYVPMELADRDERTLRPDDVLFNNTNSPELVGKTAVYEDAEPRAFSNHMTRIRCRAEVLDPRYCAAALHFRWQSGHFASVCNNHVSQASISRAVLLATEIPLPPLAEQKRIVAKVESLLAKVQSARARLARAPLLLKRLRQSILAAACDGRLTEDWRTESSSIEPAEQMIRRLRNEPILESDFPSEQWRGRSSRAIDGGDLPDIPTDWAWIRLPDSGYMNRGRSRNRPRNARHLFGGPYPFIQTGDIARASGRITSHQRTYSDAGLAQSRLWPAETVCITIAANIANSALLTYPACFPDSVVGIVTDKQLCRPEYIEYFMRTARENLSAFAPATAQKNINIGILEEVFVPLPPIAEQCEIVRRVYSLFNLVGTIERRVAAATARADKLTQAILAKAFRGELVPTEADLAATEGRDYESATAMLARIRSEQAVILAPSGSAARDRVRSQVERGQVVLDILLLLEAWKKPVSITALEPGLVLMRNDTARETLLAGKAPRRGKKSHTATSFIQGLDDIYSALEQSGAIQRVGKSAFKLAKPELLAPATAADRARARDVIRAVSVLDDIRILPVVVAGVTHERYEVGV